VFKDVFEASSMFREASAALVLINCFRFLNRFPRTAIRQKSGLLAGSFFKRCYSAAAQFFPEMLPMLRLFLRVLSALPF